LGGRAAAAAGPGARAFLSERRGDILRRATRLGRLDKVEKALDPTPSQEKQIEMDGEGGKGQLANKPLTHSPPPLPPSRVLRSPRARGRHWPGGSGGGGAAGSGGRAEEEEEEEEAAPWARRGNRAVGPLLGHVTTPNNNKGRGGGKCGGEGNFFGRTVRESIILWFTLTLTQAV